MGVTYSNTLRYPILPRSPKTKYWSKKDGRSQSYSHNITYRRERISTYMTGIPATGPFVQYFEAPTVSAGAVASKTFQRNANWKQIVAKHGDATYPFTRTGGGVNPVTYRGTGNVFSSNSRYTFQGSQIGLVLVNDVDDLIARDRALGKLKRKLSDHVGRANFLPPLAESREIHSLIRSLCSLTGDALEAAINLRKTRGKSAFKFLSQLWLGYSFGVRPLVSDIQKAADSLDKYLSNTDHRARFTGTEKVEWWSSGNFDDTWAVCASGFVNIKSLAKHKLSYRYIATASLKVSSGEDYTLAQHFGLELGQIPSALWELTCLSWVVDYFTTVGPWLEDVFYVPPGTVEYVMLNRRYELTTDMTARIVKAAGANFAASGSCTPGKFEYFNFSRTKLASLPYRGLRVKSVDEVGKFAVSKLLNLVSVYGSTWRR